MITYIVIANNSDEMWAFGPFPNLDAAFTYRETIKGENPDIDYWVLELFEPATAIVNIGDL